MNPFRLPEAFHRILARDVHADVDIPGFTRSVVDGFAVHASDTTGSGDTIPSILALSGRVEMGVSLKHRIKSGECIYVPTGGILPEGADSVVMIEHAEQNRKRSVSEKTRGVRGECAFF